MLALVLVFSVVFIGCPFDPYNPADDEDALFGIWRGATAISGNSLRADVTAGNITWSMADTTNDLDWEEVIVATYEVDEFNANLFEVTIVSANTILFGGAEAVVLWDDLDPADKLALGNNETFNVTVVPASGTFASAFGGTFTRLVYEEKEIQEALDGIWNVTIAAGAAVGGNHLSDPVLLPRPATTAVTLSFHIYGGSYTLYVGGNLYDRGNVERDQLLRVVLGSNLLSGDRIGYLTFGLNGTGTLNLTHNEYIPVGTYPRNAANVQFEDDADVSFIGDTVYATTGSRTAAKP